MMYSSRIGFNRLYWPKLTQKRCIILGIGIGLFIALLPIRIFGVSADFDFDFDFENYNTGEIVGQEDWAGITGRFEIINTDAYTGNQSLKAKTTGTNNLTHPIATWTAPMADVWAFEGALKAKGTSNYGVEVSLRNDPNAECFKVGLRSNGDGTVGMRITANYKDNETGVVSGGTSNGSDPAGIILPGDTWIKYRVEIDINERIINYWYYDPVAEIWYEFKAPTGYSWWFAHMNPDDDFTGINLLKLDKVGDTHQYFDDIKFYSLYSLSTLDAFAITDTTAFLGASYTTVDTEIFPAFQYRIKGSEEWKTTLEMSLVSSSINFVHQITGLTPDTDYEFRAIGFENDPAWHPPLLRNILISGDIKEFKTATDWDYVIPDWQDWYDENARFATPTAMFAGFAGLLSPIFQAIGNFGAEVEKMIDPDDAKDLGISLGLVFPKLRHYITEIEVFIGGFPVIGVFLIILVLLISIFLFRLVIKFIPGWGG